MQTQGGGIVGSLSATPGTSPTLAIYDSGNVLLDASNWITPIMESLTVTPEFANTGDLLNYEGDIVAMHWCGESYRISIRVKSFGTTASNARISSNMLGPGFTCITGGFPVIKAGSFSDVLNVGSGSTLPGAARLIYSGEPLDLSNTGPAGRTLVFRRCPKILGGAIITS